MASFLHKLLFGTVDYSDHESAVYKSHNKRVYAVWHNVHHSDIGIERAFRLLLLLSQYILPGLHVRALGRLFGAGAKEIVVELFVILKILIPVYFLFFYQLPGLFTVLFIAYFLSDSLNYITSIIFLDDVFPKTHSYRRTLILLFMNYLEVIFSFAVFYQFAGLRFNSAIHSGDVTLPLDFLYYSIMIATSIGFGDIIPLNNLAKIISIFQSILFLLFILFFFNFFNSRLENLKRIS